MICANKCLHEQNKTKKYMLPDGVPQNLKSKSLAAYEQLTHSSISVLLAKLANKIWFKWLSNPRNGRHQFNEVFSA